jgi:hypothetical protein
MDVSLLSIDSGIPCPQADQATQVLREVHDALACELILGQVEVLQGS